MKRIIQITGFSVSGILILLGIGLQFFNPFVTAAIKSTAGAQPIFEESEAMPTVPDWCLAGDFQEWQIDTDMLNDDGLSGDKTADDGVYSLTYEIAEPGRYEWQVVACGDEAIALPVDGTGWLYTEESNQPVRFTLDTNQYDDGYFPIAYNVNAQDSVREFVAVGAFQDWDNVNPDSMLQPDNQGQLQLTYVITRPGTYTGTIVAKDTWDGYMANGRSSGWNAFAFKTSQPNERVFFRLDPDAGRISIRYGASTQMADLAFGGGARSLGWQIVGAGMLTAVVQAWLLVRLRAEWQEKAGCPQCGSYQLRRIHRQTSDTFINLVGLPVRRYICKKCHWQGRRFP